MPCNCSGRSDVDALKPPPRLPILSILVLVLALVAVKLEKLWLIFDHWNLRLYHTYVWLWLKCREKCQQMLIDGLLYRTVNVTICCLFS